MGQLSLIRAEENTVRAFRCRGLLWLQASPASSAGGGPAPPAGTFLPLGGHKHAPTVSGSRRRDAPGPGAFRVTLSTGDLKPGVPWKVVTLA